MWQRFSALALLSLLLSACASLDDFQQMDTQTRTEYVCERDRLVSHQRDKLAEVKNTIAEIEQALLNGYRLVEACTETIVESSETVCVSSQVNGQLVTTCTATEEPTLEKICTDTPVAIDGELEKEKLVEWQKEQLYAERRVNDAYMACFNEVGSMTAEQAYDYYLGN